MKHDYSLTQDDAAGPVSPPDGDGWEFVSMSATAYGYCGKTFEDGHVYDSSEQGDTVWILWRRAKQQDEASE